MPKSITSQHLEDSLVRLRSDIETMLGKTEERVMTALFGFVNSAGSRMSALEAEDLRLWRKVHDMEARLKAIEKRIGAKT